MDRALFQVINFHFKRAGKDKSLGRHVVDTIARRIGQWSSQDQRRRQVGRNLR